MSKQKKQMMIGWLVTAVLLLIVYALIFRPFLKASVKMPDDGDVVMKQGVAGEIELSWPMADGATGYIVTVLSQKEEELFSQYVLDGTTCTLPSSFNGASVDVRIDCVKTYSILGMDLLRRGSIPIEFSLDIVFPQLTEVTWKADVMSSAVTISCSVMQGDGAAAYWVKDKQTSTPLLHSENGELEILFGDDQSIPIPPHDTTYHVQLAPYRKLSHVQLIGYSDQTVDIVREDLLGLDLHLTAELQEDNAVQLEWTETKGTYYEVQIRRGTDTQWETVCRADHAGERRYRTAPMASSKILSFRVLAIEDTAATEQCVAASQPQTITTALTPLYATIWPLHDLPCYADAARTQQIGTASALEAYCVLAEQQGSFCIRFGDRKGYIDSRYCMIDLAAYLGDLCDYTITNSYSSVYKAQQYPIPSVTDTVIIGYEEVEWSAGEYFVPLLYPTAQKLYQAACEAFSRGYAFRVYDAFRPRDATVFLYQNMVSLLDTTVIEPSAAQAVRRLPTYREAMTNAQYGVSHFLAAGYSNHNLGIAVDLTLIDRRTGEELAMQTAMHDLSWHSSVDENNDAARLLDEIMKDAGFAGLASEWWHFQDDELKTALELKTYREQGVTAQGWVASSHGWKYRLQDGSFYKSTTQVLDGASYRFDEDGYAQALA